MIVSEPISITEPDLLEGLESETLIICDLGGGTVKEIPPPLEGWTHELLRGIDYDEIAPFGWDAFLKDNDNWIGGSEV